MDWPVLRYFLDATIWFMLVSVTASTWRMLAWNCSEPSPPSCHWICRGVIYKTREWQPLVTTRDSVISHLLNVQISLTWDYRYVGINLHTFCIGERSGRRWSGAGEGWGESNEFMSLWTSLHWIRCRPETQKHCWHVCTGDLRSLGINMTKINSIN